MKLTEMLSRIYREIQETYPDGVKRNVESFYQYVEDRYSSFINLIKMLDEEELITALRENGFFKGNLTKQRFSNFCNLIFNECITILDSYYKGNVWAACKMLNGLLKSKHKMSRYWEDEYINSFSFEFMEKNNLYRMVDFNENEILEDCWHIHYEKRMYASYSRYNMASIPCLYLADSENTANKECGVIQKGKRRWISCFKPRNKKTLFFDLRIPTENEFDRYNLIDLIITYPIRFLCSAKVVDGYYHEEYYFPQLLFHLFFMSDLIDLRFSYKGFVYSSTANIGGENYVLPALYKQQKPLLSGISPELEKLFEATKPTEYKE